MEAVVFVAQRVERFLRDGYGIDHAEQIAALVRLMCDAVCAGDEAFGFPLAVGGGGDRIHLGGDALCGIERGIGDVHCAVDGVGALGKRAAHCGCPRQHRDG